MTRDEAVALLKGRKPETILFVEHQIDKFGKTVGRFFDFSEQGLVDITRIVGNFNESGLLRLMNTKKNCGVYVICTRKPESIVRDISEEVYGKWNVIKSGVLPYNEIF